MNNIKLFFESEAGKEAKQLLLSEFLKLRNIENIKNLSKAQDQAIEFKAQLKAVETLKNILGKIISLENLEEFEKEKYYNF